MLFLSHNVLRLMRQCRIEISEEVFRKDDYNSVWESLEETVAAFGNNHCLEHLEIKLDTRRFVFTTRPNRKFALVKGNQTYQIYRTQKKIKTWRKERGVVHVVHDPLVEEDDDDGEFDDDEFEEVQEDGEYAEYWTPVGPHDDPRRYSKYKHCLEPLADLQGIKEVLMDGPCDDHFSRHLAEVMMGKRPKPPPKEYPSKVVKRRRPGHIRIHRQETVTTRKFYEPTLQWDKSASEASKTDGGPNV
ncbi:hypothetical protein H2199_005672 [Coniosporium tulheliwenetii]|uniref:Uncharacterized protein n=1 Tax=Coniosporium tulheliwenetii TaxID=3383036 RepID=A0ACC2Z0R1_9PEZI|nr:hypothetical protein H2199_005672 [Cladosporium sp. JES 115]